MKQQNMIPEKPKIFISSTIYDFSDLRSAIKFFLESYGYEVLLSEYNDFQKDLTKNSYEACLKAIENCQYFILLIGSRVGGYYNTKNKISISQQEYRKAYELHKQGKLKILSLVRENLWIIKNERSKLQKVLIKDYKNKYDLSKKDIKKIANFKGAIADDAEFIINFINEIGRVEEMKTGEKPVGNWIHQFKTFSDIVEVLKREFNFSENLDKLAMLQNVKEEVFSNLRVFFQKMDNEKIYPIFTFANKVASTYKGDLNGTTTFAEDDFKMFPLFILFGLGRSNLLKVDFIKLALQSGKFLQYEHASGNFTPSIITTALSKFNKYIYEIKSLEEMPQLNAENRTAFFEKHYKKSTTVSNVLLFAILKIHKLQENIINLGLALYLDISSNFKTKLLENFVYDESGPSPEIDKELKVEEITEKDLLQYILDLGKNLQKPA